MRSPSLALCFGLTGVRFAICGAVGAGACGDRRRRRPRRVRRAHRPAASGAEQVRRRARIPERQYRVRDRAGADHLPVVAAICAASFGWIAALALAVCCALRLARYNSRIDADRAAAQVGRASIPAFRRRSGPGLAFVPLYLWLITGNDLFQDWRLVMPWTLFIAVLMISSVPTYTWRLDPHPARLAHLRACRRGFARRGAAQRAVDHAAGDFGALPGDDPVQHRRLCAGQAAARRRGVAR